ncbi:MAG: DUF3604 domain-containing protein [Chloroflexota bacterium]|nr:MAG: DUF3604 domain-containing protein [Chloroflexota bacterium]
MTDPTSALGRAAIDPPGPVIAGSYGTWRVTYAAGSQGITSGGRIRIHTDSDTDWGIPQLQDPASADYLSVQAPPGISVSVRVDGKALTLLVHGQGLSAGESLVVTYGDRAGGGPGSRAQCFAESRRYFHIDVAPDATSPFSALPDSPHLAIVGGDAAKLIVIAESTCTVGDTVRILVRAEDAWGNPAAAYRGAVTLTSDALAPSATHHTFGPEDAGLWWLDGRVTRPGVQSISAQDAALSFTAVSNPIVVTAQPAAYALHWGDPHGGQIADARKIRDFFRYARDAAAISFVGYQRNDEAHSIDDYATQQAAEREFAEPGRFIPLPGFEWSPNESEGGHHNVYFRRQDQPMRRSSHSGVKDLSDVATDLPHVVDLYGAYRGTDTLITPHVGGEPSKLDWHEPTLEPALEVTSTHGSFEWFLRESLERRYQMGFLGGSDGYDGRPGANGPGHQERRYAKGGLTGLYLYAGAGLTLDAVHEALAARRCYATTGARIVADVRLGHHLMGESVRLSGLPTLSVTVHGTAPLESVELFRGLDRIYRHGLSGHSIPNAVRLLWQGASRKTSYSGVCWDGTLRVDGASIARIEKIRFDSPRSHVSDLTPSSLHWHSIQCGYRGGLILHLEPIAGTHASRTAIHVNVNTTLISRSLFGGHGDGDPRRIAYTPAERISLTSSLADLADAPRELPLGILDRSLTVSLAPSPTNTRCAEFSFTDRSPTPGTNPYWLRVTQADMEMAWTSPLFVDYVPLST